MFAVNKARTRSFKHKATALDGSNGVASEGRVNIRSTGNTRPIASCQWIDGIETQTRELSHPTN
jgi:hypothetical protein